MEVNYLGYILDRDPNKFRSLVQAEPPCIVNEFLVEELLGVADSMEVGINNTLLSRDAFADLYASGGEEAFTWQDQVDEDTIQLVRGLLRAFVVGAHCLLYV